MKMDNPHLVCMYIKDDIDPVFTCGFLNEDRISKLKSDPWYQNHIEMMTVPWNDIPEVLKEFALRFEEVIE